MPHLERASFSGHETFPFRYAWLKKAVDQVLADPCVFGREDAMVGFGTGKNMVAAIRHWATVCGIIEEDPEMPNNRGRVLRVTDLGSHLFGNDGWDPYLEDPATLWQCCTGRSPTTRIGRLPGTGVLVQRERDSMFDSITNK